MKIHSVRVEGRPAPSLITFKLIGPTLSEIPKPLQEFMLIKNQPSKHQLQTYFSGDINKSQQYRLPVRIRLRAILSSCIVHITVQPHTHLAVTYTLAARVGGLMHVAVFTTAIPTLLSRHTQQVSVHQRCAGGTMEGFAVQYSRDERDGVGSTQMQQTNGDSVQDAYVIFGARPSESMRFVQHSRVLMGEHSSSSSSQQKLTASKGTTTLRRRKKDPHRPRGYVSAFNYFVKARRAAYVRDEQVMRLPWLVGMSTIRNFHQVVLLDHNQTTTSRQPNVILHISRKCVRSFTTTKSTKSLGKTGKKRPSKRSKFTMRSPTRISSVTSRWAQISFIFLLLVLVQTQPKDWHLFFTRFKSLRSLT